MGGVVLRVVESGFRAGIDWTILWRGCWVHLPENGSLVNSGFGHTIAEISTGFSVGWFWKGDGILIFRCVVLTSMS